MTPTSTSTLTNTVTSTSGVNTNTNLETGGGGVTDGSQITSGVGGGSTHTRPEVPPSSPTSAPGEDDSWDDDWRDNGGYGSSSSSSSAGAWETGDGSDMGGNSAAPATLRSVPVLASIGLCLITTVAAGLFTAFN